MKTQELKKLLEEKKDLVLLDVREGEEYEKGDKIEGAQNMPMGKVFVEEGKGNIPKDKKVVAICQKGGRCEIVARELQKKGYDIEHLEGGIDAWKKN
jgi:rhodanese-related sulfurtransferase